MKTKNKTWMDAGRICWRQSGSQWWWSDHSVTGSVEPIWISIADWWSVKVHLNIRFIITDWSMDRRTGFPKNLTITVVNHCHRQKRRQNGWSYFLSPDDGSGCYKSPSREADWDQGPWSWDTIWTLPGRWGPQEGGVARTWQDPGALPSPGEREYQLYTFSMLEYFLLGAAPPIHCLTTWPKSEGIRFSIESSSLAASWRSVWGSREASRRGSQVTCFCEEITRSHAHPFPYSRYGRDRLREKRKTIKDIWRRPCWLLLLGSSRQFFSCAKCQPAA